ncbi:MAG: methyltransferase [Candidatus Acidiferrales bacterium]
MSTPAAPSAQIPSSAAMFQILGGAFLAGAVSCLAQMGIPELLASGPKDAKQLAAELGALPGPLYRLMRATASIGVLHQGTDGKFSQTPLSAILCADAKPSLKAFAIMGGRDWHGRGWSNLEHCVRTGRTAAEKMFGQPMFQWLASQPDEAAIFHQAMTELSMITSPAIAQAYDFSGIHSIVDIAGGHGFLLAAILERNPHVKGTLFEVDYVLEGAKGGPLKPHTHRCGFESGDMFKNIPTGRDAYIMKHIIHDWPDQTCVDLLKACRCGVNPGGKLLVVDSVIHPGNNFEPGKFLDLQMMLFPSGRERTGSEFAEIFAAAGWKLSRVIDTKTDDSIVEGIPA